MLVSKATLAAEPRTDFGGEGRTEGMGQEMKAGAPQSHRGLRPGQARRPVSAVLTLRGLPRRRVPAPLLLLLLQFVHELLDGQRGLFHNRLEDASSDAVQHQGAKGQPQQNRRQAGPAGKKDRPPMPVSPDPSPSAPPAPAGPS